MSLFEEAYIHHRLNDGVKECILEDHAAIKAQITET